VCSGTSERMLRSLVRAANEAAVNLFYAKGRVLGTAENGWIAIDYGDIVIHIFSPDKRNYYQLEELWSQGKTMLKIK